MIKIQSTYAIEIYDKSGASIGWYCGMEKTKGRGNSMRVSIKKTEYARKFSSYGNALKTADTLRFAEKRRGYRFVVREV